MDDPLERLRRERLIALVFFCLFLAVAVVVQLVRAALPALPPADEIAPRAAVTELDR